MMRKDVKIGFVVGGILVAVLIAVALVSGPKKTPPAGADLVAGDTTSADQSTGSGAAPPSVADASAARSAEAPSPTTAPSDKASDPFKPADGAVAQANSADQKKPADATAEDKWMMALNNGVMPMIATNPAPAESVRSSPKNETTPIARSDSSIPQPVAPAASDHAAPSTQPTAGARTHVVQQYETLSTISAAAYGDARFYPYIQRANPNVDPRKLKAGMVLKLPSIAEVKGSSAPAADPNSPAAAASVDSKTQYVVQPKDSLQKIAMKLYGDSQKWSAIYALNKDQIGSDPAKLKVHSVLKLPEPPTSR